MPGRYVVVVESNLVSGIERAPREAGAAPPASPLEIGSALAGRYRARGCIDGRYEFDDAPGARVFAVLCLQFTKAIAERRLAAVEALAPGFEAFVPDDGPASGPGS